MYYVSFWICSHCWQVLLLETAFLYAYLSVRHQDCISRRPDLVKWAKLAKILEVVFKFSVGVILGGYAKDVVRGTTMIFQPKNSYNQPKFGQKWGFVHLYQNSIMRDVWYCTF